MALKFDKTKYLFFGTKKLKEYFKKTNATISTPGKYKDFNAFACFSTNTVIIHTEAHYWKFLIGLGNETSLVDDLCMSLIHENCHLIISDLGFGGNSYPAEEKVVRSLAGQD